MRVIPSILTQQNLPKPVHGLNPRTIKGSDWWDKKRKEAYESNEFHCIACGVHKSQADYHQWLEAHESYDINYETGKIKLIEIIPLCHCCHNFIHSGRLEMMYRSGDLARDKFLFVLYRGFKILKSNGLKPFYGTALAFYEHVNKSKSVLNKVEMLAYEQRRDSASWDKWHIEIDGKKYFSKFKNEKEWSEFYNKKG